jgi:HD-like signal output (HDOD) protein
MANWVRRVSRFFGTRPEVAPQPLSTLNVAAGMSAGASEAAASAVVHALPDLDTELFDWLLDVPPSSERAINATEALWLAELDPLIAADKGRGELLPRAAGLIPPLINSLRNEVLSSAELAQQVARDANLVAEVVRLANSIAFRGREPVTELADAVRRIGTGGVRQAIAKVVLKPMFDTQSGKLAGRAAARLWSHSQAQADLCRAVGLARGLDPFEAYLGGLLLDIGWSAGLQVLDRVVERHPSSTDLHFSAGFKQSFRHRRERLFAQFVTAWRLNPALHEAAREVQQAGSLAAAGNPLAQVLCAGEQLAALNLLTRAGRCAGDPSLPVGCPEGVREVYAALD